MAAGTRKRHVDFGEKYREENLWDRLRAGMQLRVNAGGYLKWYDYRT
jgi:hypothetical protein